MTDGIDPKLEALVEAGYECSQILVAMGLHKQGRLRAGREGRPR